MSGGQDDIAYDQQQMRDEARRRLHNRLAEINRLLPESTGEEHSKLWTERERILDLLED